MPKCAMSAEKLFRFVCLTRTSNDLNEPLDRYYYRLLNLIPKVRRNETVPS